MTNRNATIPERLDPKEETRTDSMPRPRAENPPAGTLTEIELSNVVKLEAGRPS